MKPLNIKKMVKGKYFLPGVVAVCVAALLLSFLSYPFIKSTITLANYQSVARDTAVAGIEAAKACITSGNVEWTDKGATLKPDTGCNGSGLQDRPSLFYYDQDGTQYDSTYEVKGIAPTSNPNVVTITAVGKVFVKDANGNTVQTIEETVKVTATKTNTATGRVSKVVEQVSAGPSTACAVAEFRAICWGSNTYGQLGTGKSVAGNAQTVPVAVATNLNAIAADPGVCSQSFFGTCTKYSRAPSPAQPASALAGKDVTKVAVGSTHACALADAQVFCWGDNSHGQLGNRSTTDSLVPVAVDTKKEYTPPATAPSPCGGWFQPSCTPVAQPTQPKSGLAQKEVIDIAAGDAFTCALASDGSVSCWGYGANGRLGINSTADANIPQPVYKSDAKPATAAVPSKCLSYFFGICSQSTPAIPAVAAQPPSPLFGKKVAALARTKGATMCVIADNQKTICWGLGVGSGAIPASYTTACNATSAPADKKVYFDALQPRETPNLSMLQKQVDITTDSHVNALGTGNSMIYWWGLNGYIQHGSIAGTCEVTVGSNGLDSSGNKCGGGSNHGSPGCGSKKETRHSIRYTFAPTGSDKPIGPLYGAQSGALANSRLGVTSGDAYDGLFCGTKGVSLYCDVHGTAAGSGQLGNGYVQQCTTSGWLFFTSTTCDPVPVGPQQVTSNGWLSGKTVNDMDTGDSGYTCVVANNAVGCWGANGSGQLGTGDAATKNVPTAVSTGAGSALGSDGASTSYVFGQPISI